MTSATHLHPTGLTVHNVGVVAAHLDDVIDVPTASGWDKETRAVSPTAGTEVLGVGVGDGGAAVGRVVVGRGRVRVVDRDINLLVVEGLDGGDLPRQSAGTVVKDEPNNARQDRQAKDPSGDLARSLGSLPLLFLGGFGCFIGFKGKRDPLATLGTQSQSLATDRHERIQGQYDRLAASLAVRTDERLLRRHPSTPLIPPTPESEYALVAI